MRNYLSSAFGMKDSKHDSYTRFDDRKMVLPKGIGESNSA